MGFDINSGMPLNADLWYSDSDNDKQETVQGIQVVHPTSTPEQNEQVPGGKESVCQTSQINFDSESRSWESSQTGEETGESERIKKDNTSRRSESNDSKARESVLNRTISYLYENKEKVVGFIATTAVVILETKRNPAKIVKYLEKPIVEEVVSVVDHKIVQNSHKPINAFTEKYKGDGSIIKGTHQTYLNSPLHQKPLFSGTTEQRRKTATIREKTSVKDDEITFTEDVQLLQTNDLKPLQSNIYNHGNKQSADKLAVAKENEPHLYTVQDLMDHNKSILTKQKIKKLASRLNFAWATGDALLSAFAETYKGCSDPKVEEYKNYRYESGAEILSRIGEVLEHSYTRMEEVKYLLAKIEEQLNKYINAKDKDAIRVELDAYRNSLLTLESEIKGLEELKNAVQTTCSKGDESSITLAKDFAKNFANFGLGLGVSRGLRSIKMLNGIASGGLKTGLLNGFKNTTSSLGQNTASELTKESANKSDIERLANELKDVVDAEKTTITSPMMQTVMVQTGIDQFSNVTGNITANTVVGAAVSTGTNMAMRSKYDEINPNTVDHEEAKKLIDLSKHKVLGKVDLIAYKLESILDIEVESLSAMHTSFLNKTPKVEKKQRTLFGFIKA